MQIKYIGVFILTACAGLSFSSELEFGSPKILSKSSDPANVSNTQPKIIRSENGTICASWVRPSYKYVNDLLSNRTYQIICRFSTDGGTNWGSEKTIGDLSQFNQSPDLATSGTQDFIFGWSSGDNFSEGRLHLAKTSNAGNTFTSETRLSSLTEFGYLLPKVAVANSSMVIGKTSRDGNGGYDGYLIRRSSWGTEFLSVVKTGIITNLVSDNNSNLIAIHKNINSKPTYSISYNEGLDWSYKGTFSNLLYDTDMTLATNQVGTWIIAATRGLGGKSIFLHQCDSLNSGWFGSPRELKIPISGDGYAYKPTISGDRRGNWLIVVSSADYFGDGALFYSVSTDNGSSWSSFQMVPGSSSLYTKNVLPSLNSIGERKWGLVWSTYSNGTSSKVAFMEIGFPKTAAEDWQLFE